MAASSSADSAAMDGEDVEVHFLDEEKMTVVAKMRLTMAAVQKSEFLSTKMLKRWSEGREGEDKLRVLQVNVAAGEVKDYLRVLKLMASESTFEEELDDVNRTLTLLNISSVLLYDEGIEECLQYLRDVPWQEGEETEEVLALLDVLQVKEGETLLQTREMSTSPYIGKLLAACCCKCSPSNSVEYLMTELIRSTRPHHVNKKLHFILSCLHESMKKATSCCDLHYMLRAKKSLLIAWIQYLKQAGKGHVRIADGAPLIEMTNADSLRAVTAKFNSCPDCKNAIRSLTLEATEILPQGLADGVLVTSATNKRTFIDNYLTGKGVGVNWDCKVILKVFDSLPSKDQEFLFDKLFTKTARRFPLY